MSKKIFAVLAACIGATIVGAAPNPSRAANIIPLASFSGADGADPYAGLLADATGNLFGTTAYGGTSGNCSDGCGTAFEIAKAATGYDSAPISLFGFNLANGARPKGDLTRDAAGNLFGTTVYGGEYSNCNPNSILPGCGTVFEIAKTDNGYASTPITLTSFNGSNLGAYPYGGLIVDAGGNLLGTTELGGVYGAGTVFEIAKTASGYAATATILVSFNYSPPFASDGYEPVAGLIADASGNLFGTTYAGGADYYDCGGGCGAVFEIAKTASGYASTATTLASFNGADGARPAAGLVADAAGNLFGTTVEGGMNGRGTVFEIKADSTTATGYASTPITLVSFGGADGAEPYAGLSIDAFGNLFGTTSGGGALNYGTVFEIAKTASGYASTPNTLVSFNFTDGAFPQQARLIADDAGNLFGTTAKGGAHNAGTVFEVTGAGFVPPLLAENSGERNCMGKTIGVLVSKYRGLDAAAKALGFLSVRDLQKAVLGYCGA